MAAAELVKLCVRQAENGIERQKFGNFLMRGPGAGTGGRFGEYKNLKMARRKNKTCSQKG